MHQQYVVREGGRNTNGIAMGGKGRGNFRPTQSRPIYHSGSETEDVPSRQFQQSNSEMDREIPDIGTSRNQFDSLQTEEGIDIEQVSQPGLNLPGEMLVTQGVS